MVCFISYYEGQAGRFSSTPLTIIFKLFNIFTIYIGIQVQIRPWNLADSDFVMDGSQTLDPRKTIFVGGVPRPLRASRLPTYTSVGLFTHILFVIVYRWLFCNQY